MPGSAQVDRAAVVTEGPHRTEHVDSHDPILRAGSRPRPTDLEHRLTRAGHFMAEEAPDEIAAAIRGLLAR